MGAAVGEALEREAFEAFPYAMLVLDPDGRVLCANAAATRLIGEGDADVALRTCCELFGCGVVGGSLAGSCVSRLLMDEAQGAARELRVKLTTAAGPVPVWLVAGRLTSDRMALQMRPAGGESGHGRVALGLGPSLYLRCLGPTEVRSNGRDIGGGWLDQRAGQLLKFLVASRSRPVTVDEIAENIWRDASYQAANSVRYYVHSLRLQIEPGRPRRGISAFIDSRAGTYRLNSDRVDVDVDLFERKVRRALSVLGGDRNTAVADLETALALYSGDFLVELPYADWALPERQRLHDLACSALRVLAADRLGRDEVEEAAGALDRLGELQPFDEDVQRDLIGLELRRGRRSCAVRRYTALCARSRRVFGEPPGFELTDLAEGLGPRGSESNGAPR